MAELKLPRLLAAAKEFNIGQDTLIEFLVKKGFNRDDLKPTAKLTEDHYYALQAEFQSDKVAKNKADQVEIPKVAQSEPKKKKDEEVIDVDRDVHGYPTSSVPYNPMYDVKNHLPLFTKSNKSKSVYCAGYYIIKFDKGWVKSFCPKLITIERYQYEGPFKTEMEMKHRLNNANR
jgi:hypothetical protein